MSTSIRLPVDSFKRNRAFGSASTDFTVIIFRHYCYRLKLVGLALPTVSCAAPRRREGGLLNPRPRKILCTSKCLRYKKCFACVQKVARFKRILQAFLRSSCDQIVMEPSDFLPAACMVGARLSVALVDMYSAPEGS